MPDAFDGGPGAVPGLAVPETTAALPALAEAAVRAREFARNARAGATLRSYANAMRDFSAWATARGLPAMPAAPETVGLYLADRAKTLKVGTLGVRLAAISVAHRLAGHRLDTRHPAIRETLAGIRRAFGTAPTRKAALTVPQLRAMVEGLPDTNAGRRDKALLLLGFAAALRRSEAVALDAADIAFGEAGMTVLIRKSKTDQEGEGASLGVPFGRRESTCPVRAMRRWLEAAQIAEGPVFRPVRRGDRVVAGRLYARGVAEIVKRAAAAIGLDPAALGGHSLRAGFLTAAAEAGAPEHAIMRQSRHKSVAVARTYIRHGSLFIDHAGTRLDL